VSWTGSESTARSVSVAVPLYVGAALVIRRSVELVVFAVGTCADAAVCREMYILAYWVT
jgi:hypothetical protein